MKNYSAVEENIKEVEEKEVEENIKEFKYKEYLLYDNTLIIDNDDIELAAHIAMIKKLVKRIIKSEGELFSIKEYSKGSKTIDCKIPDFFKQMKIFTDIAIIQNIALRFPLHCLNPYIELFIKNMTAEANLIQQWYNSFRAYELYDDTKLVECVDAFNAFAKNIKSEADSPEFTETLINYRRPLNKHFKSLIDYIDELFERPPGKLLVLRLDFHYRKDLVNHYPTELERNEEYQQAKKDLKHFFANTRHNKLFKHMLGYAWKLDYSPVAGFHFHLFFFYNDKMVQADIDAARMLGEYWRNTVTQGRGRYFNCNAEKDKYKNLGIGKIHSNDTELREGLRKAVEYITKTDTFNARMVASEPKGKIFIRRNMPKPS